MFLPAGQPCTQNRGGALEYVSAEQGATALRQERRGLTGLHTHPSLGTSELSDVQDIWVKPAIDLYVNLHEFAL